MHCLEPRGGLAGAFQCQHWEKLTVLELHVCSPWGTPARELVWNAGEGRRMHGTGREGCAARRTKLEGTGGRSQTATSAGGAESISDTTPRPSPPSPPHQLRTYPSRDGDLTQLTPSQHRTWPSNHLARATQPTPPTSVQQLCAKSRMTHQAALPVHRPSWTPAASPPLPEQCPEPLSSTGEGQGHRHPLSTDTHHLSRLKNKTQNLQT